MNKLKLCILTLAIGAMCFASCKKEENGTSNGIHFTATISTDAKTILNGVNINWVNNDQIKIFGTNTTGWIYTATPQSGNSTWADFAPDNGGDAGTPIDNVFTAIYPADAVVNSTTFTIPAEQSYATDQIVDFPMYGKSTSNDPYKLVFKNLCGALKIRLKGNTTVTGIKVTTNTYINGNYTISSDGNSIEMTAGTTNHTNSTTLSCNQELSSTQYHDFYVFLPAGNYTYVEIKIFSNDGKTFTRKLGSGNTLNVTRSKYTLISFDNPTFANPPSGALSGLFTINRNGDKIRFSKGNLIKTGNTTYAFCDEQYHYTESNATAYRHAGQRSYSSLNITNGGGNSNTWRGIRISDGGIFNYEPSTIPSRSTYRWALVKVNDIGGIILFPDNFYWPWDIIPQPTYKNRSLGTSEPTWNNINYTTAQWQVLEDAGCVFLPSYNGDNESRYWTTTIQNEGNSYEQDDRYQCYIKFNKRTNTFPGSTNSNTMNISNTNAVRLVMDVTSTMTE